MAVSYPHLLIQNPGQRLEFAPKGGGGTPTSFPVVQNRRSAADRILKQVRAVVAQAQSKPGANEAADFLPMTVRASTEHGISASVPSPRRNEVLSFFGYDRTARANVALDPSTLDTFEEVADRYVGYSPTDKRKPNHFNFFEGQPEIGPTMVKDLWASTQPLPEPSDEILWEVWLQPVAEPRFREALETLKIPNPPRGLEFEDLRVIGLPGTLAAVEEIVRSASIAQLRPASTLNSGLLNMTAGIQQAAVTAAARRVTAAPESAAAVCILDTGVNGAHPLLANSLRFAAVAGGTYPSDDYHGHGTQMAGVALYENLAGLVSPGGTASLATNLESVAIEPPAGAAASGSLPATRLREAVELVERSQNRARTYCLAMNATEETDDGAPSSLSCAVDALSADVATPRLFCVAAGNVDGAPAKAGDYQNLNEVMGIRSPAQAWNALTVAACTELVGVPATHQPVAPAGDLSPWSRTAINWERRHKPPSKPDVVFEGGNQMIDRANDAVGRHRDLCLLTTANDLTAPLTLTGMTSAATAATAGLCARIQSEYPRLWPETVRGLVAHAAEYTPAMTRRARRQATGGTRGALQDALLMRYGYGKPDPAAAMQDAEDALTLIIQGSLLPLRLNEKRTATVLGYMRFHALPWPIEVLQGLGDTNAELRVTLSYFVQPSASAAIRGDVDLYASHGLDFDVMRPDESEAQAIGRINAAAPAPRRSTAPVPNWIFGAHRGRGGLKHDRLPTTAQDLARMGGVSVLPRKGWWNRDHLDQQVRYALIVSIRTPGAEIYTEVASEIPTLV